MARVRRPAAEWAELIDQWHASGLSLPAFCERNGLNFGTMSGWAYKQTHKEALEQARRQAGVVDDTSLAEAFVPVRVLEAGPLGRRGRHLSGAEDRGRGGVRCRDLAASGRRAGGPAVLSLPSALRIFLAVEPADMRKGFDGLTQLVRERIAEDPLSGHLFVFRNRRRDRVKILYWDRDGLALWYKRLEKGTFRFPEAKGGRVEVTPAEMAAILEGIDLVHARRLPRFALPGTKPA